MKEVADLAFQERENRLQHLRRIQKEMSVRDIGSLVLFDPINIRYACGFSNEQIFQCHTPSTYLFVPAEGAAILHYRSDRPCLLSLGTLREVRDAVAYTCFAAGPRIEEQAREMARVIKSTVDVAHMEEALAVAEAGIARMHDNLRPGVTENELWSHLHQVNIAQGGEWIETRLLSSGERTNPWFQECNDRIIKPGDLVAFDTDLIGPHGCCANFSRTSFCQPGRPSDDQRRLYAFAYEQIQHNLALLWRVTLVGSAGRKESSWRSRFWWLQVVAASCRSRHSKTCSSIDR